MIDMGSIGAALSSFNALKDIGQAMITLRDEAAIQSKVIEFNRALLDAQSSIFAVNQERTALIEAVGKLEKENAALKAWEAEKQRYKLEKLPPGVFVRTLKEEVANGEPMHHACERCYREGKISPLNQSANYAGVHYLKCTGCGTELQIGVSQAYSRSREGTPWGS